MKPEIAYPSDWALPSAVQLVLQQMFQGYPKIVLQQEFTEGQSGTHVLLAVAEHRAQNRELPVVVKIGPAEVIQQEVAATQHVARKLPDFVALDGEPVYVEGNLYGGLRYKLAGNGLFRTESLRAYSRHATTLELYDVFEKRLFPQLHKIWHDDPQRETRHIHASYDRVLPVNLLVQPLATAEQFSHTPTIVLDAEKLQNTNIDFQPAHQGALVQLQGFSVTEIERAHQSVTLNVPQRGDTRHASFRLRLQGVEEMDRYRIGAVAPTVSGRVVATRQDLLTSAARNAVDKSVDLAATTLPLPGNSDIRLPNPLPRWPALLQQTLPMKIGTVHGDLNMGNVLVDTQVRTTQIIDCAHARRDHALYDLLRLETEALLHPLAAALFRAGQPLTQIVELYQWLDHVCHTEPHGPGQFALPQKLQNDLPDLVTPFILLTTIRNAARDYLATRADWREYYSGLALCLLGALKFASLEKAPVGQQPKAIAFWGAAAIVGLLDGAQSQPAANWRWTDITAIKPAQEQRPMGDTKTETNIDNRSGGVYFEGNQPVKIKGDVISGGTVNKTNFHGPVSGPVHTGSGDIHVGTVQNQSGATLESLFAELRNTITNTVPAAEQPKVLRHVENLDEAIQELSPEGMALERNWFQRQLPLLVDKIAVIIVHPTVAQRYAVVGEPKVSEYRQRFYK